MKKATLLSACLLLWSLSIWAQADVSAIVYSITGKAKYAKAEGAKYVKLTTGTELADAGKLFLKKGTTVGILFDGEYTLFSQEGESTVKSVVGDIEKFAESEYAELLTSQTKKAIHPYYYAVKVTKSGFGNTSSSDPPPPPPKKEKDGAGNKEYQLIRVQPIGGKVANPTPLFRWRVADNGTKVKAFKFILSDTNDKVLLEQSVTGNQFRLTPAAYNMKPGASYKWRVEASIGESISTSNVTFEFVGAEPQRNLINALKKSDIYQRGNAPTKMMLEAIVLENGSFLSAAYSKYLAASKADKKNNLPQLMYKAYLWEHDILE